MGFVGFLSGPRRARTGYLFIISPDFLDEFDGLRLVRRRRRVGFPIATPPSRPAQVAISPPNFRLTGSFCARKGPRPYTSIGGLDIQLSAVAGNSHRCPRTVE